MTTSMRASELGGARLKFLIVIVIIGSLAYAGYTFIPVAYQSYQLKDLMQHTVDTAVATGKSGSWVSDQLVKNSIDYGIPPDAVIAPEQMENRMGVRVQFTKPIEFPGYTYNYEFDHTVKSTAFLNFK